MRFSVFRGQPLMVNHGVSLSLVPTAIADDERGHRLATPRLLPLAAPLQTSSYIRNKSFFVSDTERHSEDFVFVEFHKDVTPGKVGHMELRRHVSPNLSDPFQCSPTLAPRDLRTAAIKQSAIPGKRCWCVNICLLYPSASRFPDTQMIVHPSDGPFPAHKNRLYLEMKLCFYANMSRQSGKSFPWNSGATHSLSERVAPEFHKHVTPAQRLRARPCQTCKLGSSDTFFSHLTHAR